MAFLNIEISKEVVKIESYEGKLQLHKLQKLQEKTKKKKIVFLSRNSLFSSSQKEYPR